MGVPADRAEEIVRSLKGLKINGCDTHSKLSSEKPSASPRPGDRNRRDNRTDRKNFDRKPKFENEAPAQENAEELPVRRGKVRISESAKARLLDASDLSRFEIKKPRETGLKSREDFRPRKHDGKKTDRRDRDGRGNRKNNDRHSTRKDKKPRH